jgi:hypothetical protein
VERGRLVRIMDFPATKPMLRPLRLRECGQEGKELGV